MEKNFLTLKKALALLGIWTLTVSAQAQHSLYMDNKASEVGDIITVILQENIAGSTSSDAQNSSNAEAGAGGSVSGNFLPFQPTFGSDVEVNYDSDEQVATNQGQLLEGYMSVGVTGFTPAGNLKVEGNRSTRINGELHKINLTGIIRPRDINGRNQIFSYRIGNATIDYEKEGGVKGLTKKQGFIKRAVLTGVGIVLGAAIVTKALQ